MESGSGNGKNGKYTAQQFIDAIPGTGGVIFDIASKVGCAWNTAKSYIDKYATVNAAWENERNRITDKARSNIIKEIEGGDVQTSKWWLQVMDDEFVPREKREITGKDGERLTAGVESLIERALDRFYPDGQDAPAET